MYYLPIYVNNRRMHVVKLDRATKDLTVPTFLVDASDHYEVFSLPSENIQLICDNAENVNIAEGDAYFKLEEVTKSEEAANVSTKCYRHSEGLPVYNVKICEGRNDHSVADKCSFFFEGKLGDTINEDPFRLNALYDNSPQEKEYILQFSYEHTDANGNKYIYVGAIRICEYKDKEDVFKASLDFGSEASQIHLSTCNYEEQNMDIRDAFIELANGNVNKDYWQGRVDDDKTLYKSVYHVHTSPAKTEHGYLPMKNGDETFLQSLLEITASTKDYVLLPNLKLVEQLPALAKHTNITFSDDGFMPKGRMSLADIKLNDGILRQIICNFLAVTMSCGGGSKNLHFILLVPNVYRQEKVHKLVMGLYDDFYLLKKHEIFSSYRGIEVSIVSESDASFYGVRNKVKKEELPLVSDAYYLIIDAGKGTTDFSLLSQEGEDLTKYSSKYRSGIPASGHVLTYAFYDALRTYFHGLERGDFFDEIMEKSVGKETADVLNFVSLLEQFKIRFTELTEDHSMDDEAVSLKNDNKNLADLNIFLEKTLGKGKLIPGMTKALDEKVKTMTDLLKDSIVNYAKNKGIVCENVFLTGRAFMLEPFKDAVSTMLKEEGVVESKEKIFYKEQYTKTICTFGAMKAGEQGAINLNSNMLGSPQLTEETGVNVNARNKKLSVIDRLKIWFRNFRGGNICGGNRSKEAKISFDFFYQGLKLASVRNVCFSLNGIDTIIGSSNQADFSVYYIGDGYLYKHGRKKGIIELSDTISGIPDNTRKELVKESLFPFDIVSFGLGNNVPAATYTPAATTVATAGGHTEIPLTPVIGGIDDLDR